MRHKIGDLVYFRFVSKRFTRGWRKEGTRLILFFFFLSVCSFPFNIWLVGGAKQTNKVVSHLFLGLGRTLR